MYDILKCPDCNFAVVDTLMAPVCPKCESGLRTCESKHYLWAIGPTGDMICYVDIPKEEAIKRYEAEGFSFDEEEIHLISFNDQFCAYDVYDN